jgi:4-hydroxythreonine-4-phosphate dehydrogenase
MGDPAGIGGEIALMTWRDHRAALPPFYLIDDPDRITRLAAMTGLSCPITEIATPDEALSAVGNALPVLRLSAPVHALPGDDSTADGRMVIEAIDRAIDASMDGSAAGMATNPIQKSRLYEAGFTSPGHTEYLGQRAGLAHPPIMLLAGPSLKVVPVTIHLSLKDAVTALTRDEIARTLRTTIAALKSDFGIGTPRFPGSILMPANPATWDARKLILSRLPSPRSRVRAQMFAALSQAIPCFTRLRAPPMTLLSACITIRHLSP